MNTENKFKTKKQIANQLNKYWVLRKRFKTMSKSSRNAKKISKKLES